jgi:molecular chaperone DnaK
MVLVYDLGGIVEVRASHGNTQLGGDDFDLLLAEELAATFDSLHNVDLRQDRRAWARLLRAAENAKIQLSAHPYTWVKEEYIAEKNGVPLHLEYEASRLDFERLIQPQLDETLESVRQVLRDADVEAEQIQQILLVGGSSYIPAVWELLAEEIGIEPQMSINPEEAVALGAGVQAAIIAGEPIDAILVDVTPHSLGIAIADVFMDQMIPDQFKSLIRRNTTIPTRREEKFYTMYPDQDTVRIQVYQGEHPVASHNTPLGNFLIIDLKPAHPGENAEITVQFDLDVNGILKVTAHDHQTNRQETITVEASHTRMSEAEMLAARDWADEETDETTTAETQAFPEESAVLLRRAEVLLAENTLEANDQQSVAALLERIQSAQTSHKADDLAELLETLEELLFDLDVE